MKYIVKQTLGLYEKDLSAGFDARKNIPENTLVVKKSGKKVSAKAYFQKIAIIQNDNQKGGLAHPIRLFYLPLTASIKKWRNQERRLFLHGFTKSGETLTLNNTNHETN